MMIRKWEPVLESSAPQSAQKNTNLETLRPLIIPAPAPEEQERICQLDEAVEPEQEQMEEHLGKQCFLKAALMQDLLAGKVCVNPILRESKVAGT